MTHPQRWVQKHGAWYYRVPKGEEGNWDGRTWFRLGATLAEAHETWAKRTGEGTTITRMAQAFDRYEIEYLPRLAPKSQREYRRSLVSLRQHFSGYRPGEIRPRDVYAYMDTLRNTPVTANRNKFVLQKVMRHCVRWGLIDVNPVREVERYSERPRNRYVENEEVEHFLKFATPLIRAYTRLKLLTGLRQAQLLRLQWKHWDGKVLHASKVIEGRKRGKPTDYYGEALIEVMAEVRALTRRDVFPNDFVFTSRLGTPYTGDGIRAIWRRCMKKYVADGGEPFRDHDIRAKVASDSDSLAEAQARLGHQSATTTNRVYRRKAAKVEVLKR